jgi:uncharacterized repeat protein (TIGR03803 family)
LALNVWLAAGLALALAGQPEGAQARVLYSFSDGADGGHPNALLGDAAGNFYGTTDTGGNLSCNPPYGCGVVFKLAADGTQTVIHSFNGGDGRGPTGLVQDPATGDFYGVTFYDGGGGAGVIFKLTPEGTEAVLHNFSGGDGGGGPSGLIRDSAGNLYGTTFYGGPRDFGVVYELTADGTFSILHSFGGRDGRRPGSQLIRDKRGNLYGTTQEGGGENCWDVGGCGALFKLAPDSTYTVLHAFKGGKGGKLPSRIARDEAGNIYGTTYYGGERGCRCGLLYKWAPDGAFAVLDVFHGSDGAHPHHLVRTPAGKIYGSTIGGGDAGCGDDGCGTIFRVMPDGALTILYRFTGGEKDGAYPLRLLIEDKDRNVYGVTAGGGAQGVGTVFKVRK